MTGEGYNTAVMDMVWLAGCAVRGETPDHSRAEKIDLSELYKVSERHMLSAAVSAALAAAGIRDSDFLQAEAKAKHKNALLDADRRELTACLDQRGIWYMPLKGAVIKDLYPAYGMRQMSDNDILIDPSREDEVREVMENLGFETVRFGVSNHDVYHKLPVSNFEIHTSLFDDYRNKKLYEYYKNIEDRLIKGAGSEKRFTAEDFYVYMTAHEFKHYSGSGTGIRSLLDIYVYLRRYKDELDFGYIDRELEKLEIREFEKQNRSLSFCLFDGKQLTGDQRAMLDYMGNSGTYGTQANSVRNQIERQGRLGFFIKKTFLPYRLMLNNYPVLKKVPVLLPLMWIVRLVTAIIVKPKKVLFQLKAVLSRFKDQ